MQHRKFSRGLGHINLEMFFVGEISKGSVEKNQDFSEEITQM